MFIKSIITLAFVMCQIYSSKGQTEMLNKIDSNIYDENIKHLPFQFGIEVGKGFQINKTGYYGKYGITVYFDINLFKKIIYLKTEGGVFDINLDELTEKKYDGKKAVYLSMGISNRILKTNHHKIYVTGSIGILIHKSFFLPIWSANLSTKYIYSLNNFFGLSVNLKFPFINSLNPYFSIGVQLF